jgi:hypothetical protein
MLIENITCSLFKIFLALLKHQPNKGTKMFVLNVNPLTDGFSNKYQYNSFCNVAPESLEFRIPYNR